jgi:hypothetical protein
MGRLGLLGRLYTQTPHNALIKEPLARANLRFHGGIRIAAQPSQSAHRIGRFLQHT